MSVYILMKILESAPSRYDRSIYILTLGKLDKIYDRLTSRIKKGQTILDLGCGTGALTLRAARKGAKVKGIDINPLRRFLDMDIILFNLYIFPSLPTPVKFQRKKDRLYLL